MRWIIGLVVAALLGWWGYGAFFSNDNVKKTNAPTVKISEAIAKRQDVPIAVSVPGNVVAYETVSIKSRIDSQIVAVKFHDGDAVQAGQILFLLDDRALRAQLKQLEASVQKEKAQLVNTRLQYERAQKLVETQSVSQAALDNSQAAYRSQQAVVNSIEASLENTRVQLSYCTITAPISGRAGTINVTLGNSVKANDTQAFVTINRISPIRVQFAIPERYYEQVKQAMAKSVPVHALRPNAENTLGTLEYINNTIDTTTGAFLARAIFPNEKESLWPGMFVTASVELGNDHNALTIPAVAVQGDEGRHFVFKVVNNKAIKTPVDVMRNANDVAIIGKGLKEGDVVITDGLLRATDGSAVEVLKH